MKTCSTLLLALGFVSSAVLAQSIQPVPATPGSTPEAAAGSPPPAGMGRMPSPSMGSGSDMPATTENAGTLSTGAPAAPMTGASGGGQLITPEIAQSRPAEEETVVSVEPQTRNGVTYLCGGIGKDESEYMKQVAAKDYDLMMTFAEKSGVYVADVSVSVKDKSGKTLLETTCDAPILLVDVPAGGTYRIHADAGGRGLDRTASVRDGKGRARQLNFVWPTSARAPSGASEPAGSSSSGSDSGYGTESSGSEGGSQDSQGYPRDSIR